MDFHCDLEVDVNGEEVFIVDKKIITSYSGRISKLLGKSTGKNRYLKVIFHDFPGGAESFELMTRFCYNNGKIEINPFNLSLLHCIAHFMEMNKSPSGTLNLLEQTQKSLEEIRYWTWSELFLALRQCQGSLPVASSSGILQKCLDSLVERLSLAWEPSPCPSTSSPDSSNHRISCDTKSTESSKISLARATWWFDDLVCLNPDLVQIILKLLIFRKFDHGIISRFLSYYQKSRFVTATTDEKCKIIETVVDMLCSLDRNCVPCKSLFGILGVALRLNISKCCRNKLESMIGSQLDQAILDNLLVSSPTGKNCLYDVNLVLRLLKSFVGRGICRVPLIRLKKVGSLVDSYISEVAPDPCLRPAKFLALLRSLPDTARDSYDGLYRALHMYLEVHVGLSEEEEINLCRELNYNKLSSDVCDHLAENRRFPSETAAQALMSRQNKLQNLLQHTNQPKPSIDSSLGLAENSKKGKDEACDQIVLYAGKLNLSSDNEKLRAHLQGMQWRVLELEKVCRKMQTQMTKIMKSRLSKHSNSRSLPRLCS